MKRLTFALLPLLLACAGKTAPPSAPVELLMTTERHGEECLVTLAGQRFVTVELNSAALLRRLRSLEGQAVLLRFGDDAPYRCVGSAVFMLQRAKARFRAPQIPTE
jgi:hypothetical protein